MGSIVNNISKGINNTLGGVVSSVKNIGSGKGNLGDLLSLGSLIAPGGSIANIGKATLGSALSGIGGQAVAGALTSMGGGGQRPSGGGLGNLTNDARMALQRQLEAALQSQGLANQAISQGYYALDPSNNPANYRAYQDALDRGATQRGLAQAAALRDLGLGSATQAGAVLSSQNAAAQQGADYWRNLNDPFSIAQRRAQQAQLAMMPMQSLAQLYSLYSGSRGMDEAYRQPTALENIFAVAPSVLPYILGDGGSPATPAPAAAPAQQGTPITDRWTEQVMQGGLRGGDNFWADRYGF